MSRFAKAYSRVSPRLANKPGSHAFSKVHARLMRLSRGRLGRFLGAEVLVLRTVGRKSGKSRENPLMFVRHNGGFAVAASNAGASKTPAWWLNLQASPDAKVIASGKTQDVRAREATEAEIAEVWPQMVAMYQGFDHYKTVTNREFPVVMLEPVDG
jgi:deazaflavin-dependent oxidoreductase (nitroreductase family)